MKTSYISKIIETEGRELVSISQKLDYGIIESLIDWIASHQDKKLFFIGCGTSAMAAKKIVHTFQVINQSAFFINPSDAVHGSLGAIKEGDMVTIISKGGNTKELTCFLNNIKKKRAYIVEVTENPDSIIAKTADVILTIKVEREPDEYNMLATASTLAVISVYDAIAISLMKKTRFSMEVFLDNHPCGAVGERLNAVVDSL